MKVARRYVTVSGKYFEKVVMAHEDWLVCCDALRVFYRRRHTIDLEAEEQTISWGKQTFTIRKIDDCTWEVL